MSRDRHAYSTHSAEKVAVCPIQTRSSIPNSLELQGVKAKRTKQPTAIPYQSSHSAKSRCRSHHHAWF
ncbi:hypothetical protein FYF75_07620 [Vibrio cholerae]|nr:hypothetical protein [Vibrio cholerae]EGR1306412.1 hypothetical protein [Vibrio cholerae]EGR4118277.1 hypothetical protein [Vibrio cholerae]MCD1219866.1 hypothetical protein [Vibrio cholerae]TQQ42508.1 hypothetical protein FLL70_02820 [Vibrio cholerae]